MLPTCPPTRLQGMLRLLRTTMHQLAQPGKRAAMLNLERQGLKCVGGAWVLYHDVRLIRAVLEHGMDR